MKAHPKTYWLFVLAFFCTRTTFALTPPAGNETLCYVGGQVLSRQKEEATDMSMIAVEVNTMTLIIHATSAIDENYKGKFCEQMAGAQQKSGERTNTFRLCDKTNAREGEIIKGIVGKSLGGGWYCIEQIQAVNQ